VAERKVDDLLRGEEEKGLTGKVDIKRNNEGQTRRGMETASCHLRGQDGQEEKKDQWREINRCCKNQSEKKKKTLRR